MNVELPRSGHYIVAVSGGVDSMVLLHLLHAAAQENPGLRLTVAHLDHGIRGDSAKDRQLVQKTAKQLKLPFVYHEAQLGTGVSEQLARGKRYAFLEQVRSVAHADGLVTAHHQGDVVETALINMVRGTGRKGLSSLSSQGRVLRPLLNTPKQDVLDYAETHSVVWREDSTNSDMQYLRNHIRQQVVPKLNSDQHKQLLSILNMLSITNQQIDQEISNVLHQQSRKGQIDRDWFAHLPHAVAREVMAHWLREHGAGNFTKQTLERLTVAAKTALAGKQIDVQNGVMLSISPAHLALRKLDR